MREREPSLSDLHPARRWKSLRCAFAGLAELLRRTPHAWIHAVATIGVLAAGFAVHLSRSNWALIVIAIGLVWTAEAFNTAIEYLADAAVPVQHPLVGKAKDVAAAAVLLAAIAAFALGLLVFLP